MSEIPEASIVQQISAILLDPVLRGPLFTCISVGIFGGLLGLWLYFQRQILIGEVISHAVFPGMIFGSGLLSWAAAGVSGELELACICIGGFCSAYCSLMCMRWIVRKKWASEDASLSYILSGTFGVGLLAISMLQRDFPSLWRTLMSLLMGQAATIPNYFVPISYWFLSAAALFCILYRRSLLSYLFDREFAQLHGLISKRIEQAILVAIILASMIGIRIMGVILLSAILTFPPVIARLLSDRASTVALISMFFGGASCGLGVLVSHFVSSSLHTESGRPLWLPTGPVVVLIMAIFFLAALIFAPKHGLLMKYLRRHLFEWRCQRENVLKFFWKRADATGGNTIAWKDLDLHAPLNFRSIYGRLQSRLLRMQGHISLSSEGVVVSKKGLMAGERLVRLHRLWELYLVEYCGMDRSHVHPSAEELEHIITPEMEQNLVLLLNNPQIDPHNQPIPKTATPVSENPS